MLRKSLSAAGVALVLSGLAFGAGAPFKYMAANGSAPDNLSGAINTAHQPVLKWSWEISSPVIPHRLGWLNHWSAAAARAIGFPDPARDAELLSRSRRTSTGGWIVPLTETPLDLVPPQF